MNRLPFTLGIKVRNHDAWRWNIELLIANVSDNEITQVSLEVWPERISPSFLAIESIGSKKFLNTALCAKVPKSFSLPTTVRVTCKTTDGVHREFVTQVNNTLLNEAFPLGDSWRIILERQGIGYGSESNIESYRYLPVDLAGSSSSPLDLDVELGEGSNSGSKSGDLAVDFEADGEFQLAPLGVGLDADLDSGSQVIEIEESEAIADAVDFADADAFGDAGPLDDGVFASASASDDALALDSDDGAIALDDGLFIATDDDDLFCADDDDLFCADDDDLLLGSAGSDISIAGDSGINLMSPSDSGLSLASEPLVLAGSSISSLDLDIELGEGSNSGSKSGDLAVDFEADEECLLSPSGIDLDADSSKLSGQGESGKGTHGSNFVDLDEPFTKSQNLGHHIDRNVKKEHPRWSDVSFPHATVINEWAELTIAIILKEQLLPDGRKVPVAKPRMTDQELILKASSNEPMHVDVVVSAPGYKIKGQPFATIEVPLDRDSEKAQFFLAGLEEGPKPVLINFYQNKRYIGTVSLESCVVGDSVHRSKEKAKNNVDVDFSRIGAAPDLTLNIAENTLTTGQTELRFTIISTLDEIHLKDGGSVLLRQEPSGWLEQAFSSVEQLNRAEENVEWTLRRLQSIGNELYEQLFPVQLKEVFQSYGDRINSIMVVSDEPWIPWEMVKPSDRLSSQVSKHLCEEYRFSRWLSGTPISSTLNARSAKIVPVQDAIVNQSFRDINVVPIQGSASTAKQTFGGLPNVEKEVDMFRNLESHGTEVGVIDSQLGSVMRVIDKADYDILHFACHGSYNKQSPDLSVLQLTDGCMTSVDLNSSKPASKARRPIVFLNACHSGRGGFGLTRLGNWASAFSKLNCGAFIGSLWPVEDETAYRFAKHFYARLFEGVTIGDAFRDARISVKESGNSTWLAFCLYADPNALLSKPNLETQSVREKTDPTVEVTNQSQKAFDLALQKRNLVFASKYLGDFAGTDFYQIARSRWDWAARHEISRLSVATNSYLKAKQLRMAKRRVRDICEILGMDRNLASEAAPFLNETVRLVIALVPRGLPLTHINEMYRSFIRSFYLRPNMRTVLESDIRKLSSIIREIDKLNMPVVEGFFAKRRFYSKMNRAINRIAVKNNVAELWVRNAIKANSARWPYVVQALHPKFFAKHHAAILIENGMIKLDAGRTVEAIDLFKQAVEVDLQSAAAYNNIAWAYVVSDERDPKKLKYAVRQVQKALTLKESPAYLDTLAELERRLGNFEDALKALERAVEVEKTEPIVWADKIDLFHVETQEALESEPRSQV